MGAMRPGQWRNRRDPDPGPSEEEITAAGVEARRLLDRCDTSPGCEIRMVLTGFRHGPQRPDLNPWGTEIAEEVTARTGVSHIYDPDRKMIRPEADPT